MFAQSWRNHLGVPSNYPRFAPPVNIVATAAASGSRSASVLPQPTDRDLPRMPSACWGMVERWSAFTLFHTAHALRMAFSSFVFLGVPSGRNSPASSVNAPVTISHVKHHPTP